MSEPIGLSIVDQDGGELDSREFDTIEELLAEWPDAQDCGEYWEVWAGSKR